MSRLQASDHCPQLTSQYLVDKNKATLVLNENYVIGYLSEVSV